MNKKQLKQYCLDNPENFTIQLKRLYPNVYNKINNDYIGKNFSEKMYVHLNGKNVGVCSICNEKSIFESYKKGYRKYCSYKCSAEAKKLNAIVERVCLNCKKVFYERNSKDVKTCSVQCREEYIKSDKHKQYQQEQTKLALIAKYGVDHPSKIKGHGLSVKASKLKKYGDPNYVNSDKAKQTKLLKYENENYNNIEKYKQTMIEKYGVDNFSKTLKFKESFFNLVLNRLPDNIIPQFKFDEYTGVTGTKYSFKCNICVNSFFDYIDNGHTPLCKKCNPNKIQSSIENEIVEYIKTFYSGDIIQNDRTILKPKEIDIYIPELKIGIEVNGIFFHTEISGGKDKSYHINKTNKCSELEINLIHIFETEWLFKRKIVEGIIKSKFNISSKKIYGRKTIIKKIEYDIYSQFLDNNHLQGTHKTAIRYGCYYDNNLIAVMSFAKGRYESNCYELIRYCTINDVNIIGGFNKLLQVFVNEYHPNKIISYSDRRYFSGNVYLQNGFKLDSVTSPGYFYVNGSKLLLNRIKFQKHKLHKLLENFDPSLTEWQNMQLNGYDRIWDCGHQKFVQKFE